MNLINLFWIALGGALGSLLRFSFNFILPLSSNTFPKATFIINVFASLFLGVISGLLMNKFQDNSWLKYFLVIGFCGGFSTFSTFILEFYQLHQNAHFFLSYVYLIFSLVFAISALMLGFYLSKFISS